MHYVNDSVILSRSIFVIVHSFPCLLAHHGFHGLASTQQFARSRATDFSRPYKPALVTDYDAKLKSPFGDLRNARVRTGSSGPHLISWTIRSLTAWVSLTTIVILLYRSLEDTLSGLPPFRACIHLVWSWHSRPNRVSNICRFSCLPKHRQHSAVRPRD